jgi:hypothetical protein
MKNFFRPFFVLLVGLLLQPKATLAILGKAIARQTAIAAFGLCARFPGGNMTVAVGITGNLTMLDIAKLNGTDPAIDLIEENLKYAPEVGVFPFRTIKGTSYKTSIRTGLPTTGFRAANEGQTPGKSTFVQKLIEAFIFGGPLEVDKRVAEGDERGVAHVQAVEGMGVMKSALRNLGSQIWYGITNDAKGFPGIKAFLAFGTSTSAGDPFTINATGTTASTASSVYGVVFGEEDTTLIGGNGKPWEIGDWKEQQIVAANGGKIMAFVNELGGWIGLQIGHENCARRIANLTADANKGLTDTLMAQLEASFPVGYKPSAYFMSRRSCSQLQASRTVVLQGQGTNRPDQPTIAPRPTSYNGVPIIESDSILNTDAIEA